MMTNSDINCGAYVYRIDRNGLIESVSENWRAFAESNGGGEKCAPENLIGTPLSSHIAGIETNYLYDLLIRQVRQRQKPVRLLFRCDSPTLRRFLRMTIAPLKDDAVEFRSQILRTEPRPTVELLRADVHRSDAFLTMCSMCKKLAVNDTDWDEVEPALDKLNLFEHYPLPQITHGICPVCFKVALGEAEN